MPQGFAKFSVADGDAVHKTDAGEFTTLTEKVTPADADLLLLEDSAAGSGKKKIQVGNLPGGADPNAIHGNTAGEIVLITEKAAPSSTDVILIEDAAATNAKKRVQIGNLPTGTDATAIHDNVAAEISAIAEKVSPASTDVIVIEDSAASNAKKRVQVGNLPTGSGTVPTPTDTNQILAPNTGLTAYVSVRSRGELVTVHGAVLDGSNDDGPALRAARTALGGGKGRVVIPPGNLRINSSELVGGFNVGCSFEDGQWVEGGGMGSGRSGNTLSHGTTNIFGDGAVMDALLMWRSSAGTPDWRGAGGHGFHLKDASTSNNTVTNGILCQAFNNLNFHHISASHFLGTNAGFMKVIQATNGQPTQYGELYSFDVFDCVRGIWIAGNNPDWIIHHGKIQRPSSSLRVGSIGIYATSNKLDFHDLAIQFYDTLMYLDSNADNRSKHITLRQIHFEGDSGAAANAYAYALRMKGTTGQQENPILWALDFGNSGKFNSLITLDAMNTCRLSDIRIRDNPFMTTSETRFNRINGTTGLLDGVAI